MFEKKRGTRFLASVMALVMLLSLAPVGALAAENEDSQENTTVSLPADEANPKPVETGTANTNEETTPPPANEGNAGTTVDNNDTSAAISEMPVIMNPVDLLNQASDYTTELTWSPSSSSIEEATFFYLKTPASIPGSNETEDWGSALGNGTVNTSDLWWTETNLDGSYGHKVENSFNVTNSMINNWPSDPGEYDSEKGGYVLNKNNSHWNTIFNAYKENVEQQLGVKDLSSSDVTDIILTPFKVSRYNKTTTDKHYHVDCTVTVKCDKFATATFKLWNDETRTYKIYSAANYRKGTSVVFPPVETKPEYTFSGWYLNEELTGSALDEHTIEKNVTFYAKCTPKTYTVTFDSKEGSSVNPQNVNHGAKANKPSVPTREGYEFQGWYTGEDATASVYDFDTAVTQDITLYAHWTEDSTARPTTTDVYVYFKMVDAAGKNIPKTKINNEALKNTVYNNDAGGATWATLGKIALTGDITENTLTNAGEVAQVQLKDADNLCNKNKNIAQTVLANVQWFQLKQWPGATDYVPDGSRWHLDGKITGYTVTYNNGTTEATDAVHNMPDADDMYYLRGSEYTVSDATPTREGYVFTGWKSDNNVYYSKSKMTMPAKNVVLTAQWEKDELVDPSVDQPEGITKGDGIADKYQIQVSFEAMNGTFEGCTSPDNQYTTVVTKYDNSTNMPSENGTAKLANEHLKAATPNENHNLTGWTKNSTKCEIPKLNDIVTHGDHFVVTFEKKENPPIVEPTTKINYTINQHFMNGKGEKDSALDKPGTTQSADKDTALSELIKNLAKDQTIGNDKDNYMYVSGKYTTKSESQKDQPITSESKLIEDTTIDLYYYLDNWKDGSSVKEDNDKGGDGIPDCDQVLIKYVSSNSDRGTVSPDMEVLTIRKANEKVVPTANGSTATTTGSSRNYFSNWTKDNRQVSTNVTLNNETIQNVIKEFKGGETCTFTANFGYSSGGGSGGSNRPKPPVVEIPDDVPTGLNGKDHYAYIIGYGNNDVRPQNNITRAEVATIFFRLLTDETRTANMTKSNGYNDVKDGDWFCCAVSTLSKMGIIKGYEDGSFKPNDPISRAEFAAIAARFDPDGDKTPASFADVTSHWAKDEISIAANHGWIKGYEDGSFKPDQKITRAETMTLVNRVLNRLPETKDDLHKDMKTWVDNMDETAWYYLAVQEATNSHYFKNKTGTKFEQWTDLRDTRDWSELEK